MAAVRKLLFTVLLMGFAFPAMAQLHPQVETGSLTRGRPKAVDPVRAGEVRKEFARCIYRRSKAKATALLNASDPEIVSRAAANIKDINKELSLDACLGNAMDDAERQMGMRLADTLLRDLLAEEAYLANNRSAPVLPPPPAVAPPLQPRYLSTGTRLERAQALVRFTDCAVLKNVARADALLRTTPGSAEELAVAKAMGPSLGACLVKGQNLKLTAANIRAFIAYAMWNRFGRSNAQ